MSSGMTIINPSYKKRDKYEEYVVRQDLSYVPPKDFICPCGFMVKMENDYKCNICGRQIVFMLENNYVQ